MSRNIDPDKLNKLLKGLIGLDRTEGDARLDACISLAVTDLIDEFKDSVAINIDSSRQVVYTAATDTTPATAILDLPADLLELHTIFLGDREVTPVGKEEFLKWKKAGTMATAGEYVSTLTQNANGDLCVEFYPASASLSNTYADIVYRITGEDPTSIPKAFLQALVYGVGKEYYLWSRKSDPAIHSKFSSEYEKAKGRVTRHQIYADGQDIEVTPYNKQKWLDNFSQLSYTPATDTRLY